MSRGHPEPVWIVPTGVANLEAVGAAFRRLGHPVRPVERAEDVRDGAFVVLPGVGSFGSGLDALADLGVGGAVGDRVDRGRPTLAVCLGLQLLCEASDEAPGRAGLGRVPGRVARFGPGVRVPQLGWNRVHAPRDAAFLRTGFAYFANSYRLVTRPPGWRVATTRYGGPFVAAVERDGVLACQFHPELSGAYGARLLARWLALAPGLAAGATDGRDRSGGRSEVPDSARAPGGGDAPRPRRASC